MLNASILKYHNMRDFSRITWLQYGEMTRFLSFFRLLRTEIENPVYSGENLAIIKWHIENKYYCTCHLFIRLFLLDALMKTRLYPATYIVGAAANIPILKIPYPTHALRRRMTDTPSAKAPSKPNNTPPPPPSPPVCV